MYRPLVDHITGTEVHADPLQKRDPPQKGRTPLRKETPQNGDPPLRRETPPLDRQMPVKTLPSLYSVCGRYKVHYHLDLKLYVAVQCCTVMSNKAYRLRPVQIDSQGNSLLIRKPARWKTSRGNLPGNYTANLWVKMSTGLRGSPSVTPAIRLVVYGTTHVIVAQSCS